MKSEEYNSKEIEQKWQKKWDTEGIYEAQNSSKKPKFFGLIEFPFPSGEGMHIGHLRSNTAMDIISRKRRMQGFNVLYPIGWDAFGLPTENFAIKTGQAPQTVTKNNTNNFRRQLKAAGFSFDWSREINTSDPEYYKWTQWIFLQMYKHGLAYKKKMLINWCPKDKIGLANEEVIDGKCERCGTPVEKREKEQWMLAITKYADRLDKDLDTVDYLEKIKIQQRNWIGKSEGAEIDFNIIFKNTPNVNSWRDTEGKPAHVKVFTTRPDTIFGATYVVLSPEHPWITKALTLPEKIISNKEEVEKYIAESKKKSEIERTTENKEKTGIELQGIKALNPATQEEIPVFIADYVLAHYGTGAIMAVPAHDERDFEFAKKYNLPIKTVIEDLFVKTDGTDAVQKDKPFVEREAAMCLIKHWSEDKYLCSKWKSNDWQGFITGGIEKDENIQEAALREVAEETGYTHGKFIKELGTVHTQFYHDVKQVNRFAHFRVVYIELQNGNQKPIAAEEQKLHELHWISKDKVRDYVNRPDLKLAWDMLSPNFVFSDYGLLTNSNQFDGLHSEEAKKKITEFVGGKMVTTYKLRDWIFSRQRYWGEPIPMVYCESCRERHLVSKDEYEKINPGWVPLPEKDLPVKLPEVKNYQPTDTGESPLATMTKWVNTTCPECGGPAKRETDTMPNWAGSSWYFLRYTDPHNTKALADSKKLNYWMPIDWYNGGMEHTTLHLLYSRFWNKFLYDIGVASTSEPYQKRTSHGLILAADGEKMSKSRGNVVNPDEIIQAQGADCLRLYQMFMGPFDQTVSWSIDGVVGPRRFLERVWKLQIKTSPLLLKRGGESSSWGVLESSVHKTIKKVSEDIEVMQFNTAVSAMMILVNEFEKSESIPDDLYELFLKILAPFAPFMTEEIWAKRGHKKSIHLEAWPVADESKITAGEVVIVVQVNGKIRAQFKAISGISEEEIRTKALNLPEIQKWLDGRIPTKIIVVKGKLVSIVL